MVPPIAGSIVQSGINFLNSDVIPYLVILAIAFVTTLFAFAIAGRYGRTSLKRALRSEFRTNVRITKALVTYADAQLSGDNSVSPMPMYRTGAFQKYVDAGLLDKLPRRIAEELQQVYLSMVSVNKAGKRQEELAFGPAAAFPNAHTLRLENLTYARDTAHNVIEPYQDRLRDSKL